MTTRAQHWKVRPHGELSAPEGSRAQVEKIVPVDTTVPDFGDPNVLRDLARSLA